MSVFCLNKGLTLLNNIIITILLELTEQILYYSVYITFSAHFMFKNVA